MTDNSPHPPRLENRSRSSGELAQIACLLEVTARKLGNVHRFRDFSDLHLVDFLLSAAAVARPLDLACEKGVGEAVLAAIRATRQVVSTNTNLGMILLLAPLAAVPRDLALVDGIAPVLEATTIDDARKVYEAIRLASPGGLGRSPDQDIAQEPSVTLRDAMWLAADRDLVARQYASGYEDVLGTGLSCLTRAISSGEPLETAIIRVQLELLARLPDSLIARKAGEAAAQGVMSMAGELLAADWPRTAASLRLFDRLDERLRSDGNRLNPGTTADLVTAALFAGLRDGTIPLPRPTGATAWSGP